jgi:serine protease
VERGREPGGARPGQTPAGDGAATSGGNDSMNGHSSDPRARATIAALLAAAVLGALPAFAETPLAPRAVPDKPTLSEMQSMRTTGRVVVKFSDGVKVRIAAGRTRGLSSVEDKALREVLAAAGVALSDFRRLHARSEAELDAERKTSEAESGEALADLNNYYVVTVTGSLGAAEFAARLNTLAFVEIAEPQPAPSPAPSTPDFTGQQGYAQPPGAGIGRLDTLTHPGGDGRKVTIVDVEYSWLFAHEDLKLDPKTTILGKRTPLDFFNDTNHGTAVLGILAARDNGKGVTGLAPKATIKASPAATVERGYDVAFAIGVATGALKKGDVILIEQQTGVCGGACGEDQVGCGPVEFFQANFDAIQAATAKGIIVVEAAGNGAVNLDGPACKRKFDRTRRDSGAIVVGAGSAATGERMSFSSFGSRVDVQGWGEKVATTGYGDLYDPGPRRKEYTATFAGTSSASPIVTGAVTMIQGALKGRKLAVATPKEMRKALVKTGQVRAGTAEIGPLPDTNKALKRLLKARQKQTLPVAAAADEATVTALAAAE